MSENEGVSVICDAGPIIHLDELGALELLADFSRLMIPEAVNEELLSHRPAALRRKMVTFEVCDSDGTADDRLRVLSRTLVLHRGETEALKLALRESGSLFLTDDTAARLAAQALGIRVHGSLGILIRAIRRGHRTKEEVVRLLRQIPGRSTLHVKPSLLREVIGRVQSEGV